MRFALGGIMHESNTFCPQMTTLKQFIDGETLTGEDIVSSLRGSRSFVGGVIDAAEELGVELVPTLFASTSPYGVVEKEAFTYLLNQLCVRMRQSGAVDGVVLCLHGGMVAENSVDSEGEILARVREIVGTDTPVTCTLDMHCNVSQRMIDNCDAFFVNNENPHMDSYDRGVEATRVLRDVVEGRVEPLMALRKPGMLPPTLHVNPPHSGPLVEIFKRAFEMEEDPRVINVNVCAGFPWSDVPDAGMSVVTVVDGDQGLADELADELSQRLWEARREFIPSLLKPDEAVEKAMQAEEGPVILADVADNPGDGTTQDSTAILASLIRHGAQDALLAVINDADALEACLAAGVGGEVTLDLGCKARLFGDPVHLTGRVKTITDGSLRHSSSLYGEFERQIGRTVVLETGGIEIIVTERRNVPMVSELFWRHGIDPSTKKIIVVKTFRMHLEPKYRLFAKEVIEVDAPGQASVDMKSFNWTKIPRPMYPIDCD
jgi:microcystin degradation protein MlrC